MASYSNNVKNGWVVSAKYITICKEGISGGAKQLCGFVIYHYYYLLGGHPCWCAQVLYNHINYTVISLITIICSSVLKVSVSVTSIRCIDSMFQSLTVLEK